MHHNDFHSHEHHSAFGLTHAFGVNPEQLVCGVPSTTAEPGAVPVIGASTDPNPYTPFVCTVPVPEPVLLPEPNAAAVNNAPRKSSELFIFNTYGTDHTILGPQNSYVSGSASVGSTSKRKPFIINAKGDPRKPVGGRGRGNAPVGSKNKRKPLIEGCVAIEHLQGYVLQHKQHLTRDVLCDDGFCATPNHAIIVDGVRTSMKQLCNTGWKCTESVKLVNNLKVWANRRAIINDRITVTPYDVRFPKVASWVGQAAEEIYNFYSNSTIGARKKSKFQ